MRRARGEENVCASPTGISGVVSRLGRREMRESGWPLEGVIANHVLSHGGQAALVAIGDQFGCGLAVVALLDGFEQAGFVVGVDCDPFAASGS